MKKKTRERLKKGIAMVMAAAAIVSALPSLPMSAASERAAITFENCFDGAGNAIRCQQSVSHDNRNCGDAGEVRTRIYADGEPAFCIQPGHSLHDGNTLQANASEAWNALSGAQRNAVNLALLYGSQGNMAGLPGSEDEKVVATQLIIWEIVTGCRGADAPFTLTDGKFYEAFCAGGANAGVSAAYQQIAAGMAGHGTIPSFASANADADARELKWDGKNYVLSLTDANGVLPQFAFTSSDSSVKVGVSGNTLTITSAKAPKGVVSLSASKSLPAAGGARLVAYGDPSLQDIVTGVDNADVNAYLNVKVSYGHVKIVKTSEDGIVEGLKFKITGNGVDKTVKTGKDGSIKVENLTPGTYTVTELAEERYETQKSQKVTVKGGETAKVEFANVLKRGDLKVIKSSEDSFVEGVRFHLYGTSLSGASVDEYAVTDKNGVAMFEGILISGSRAYTLEEVDTAVRYVVPARQKMAVKWKEVTNATVKNVLKKFRVSVTKVDRETGKPQGDATLAGAVYGVYAGEKLVDTYTTDSKGQFTTKYYACGDNWSVREISPSEGYLLDKTIHHVGAEAGNFTIELNSVQTDAKEQVSKGRISIIKHTDDGSTQIETPEEGAEFQVYLKKSGSYGAAEESERDTLVCDKHGYAQTKELPYGTYTVHQTKGWDGRELMGDFDVYVSRDGETYRYIINNRDFESCLKVVKKDKETGKIIPLSGAGYQIYDSAGELVTMKYTYPEVTVLDTFHTASGGYLIPPEPLPYGDYTLVEVQAPYGYVLDGTPIPFTISEDNSTEEGGVTVVSAEQEDMPQKGKILVEKTAGEFESVQVSGGGVPDKSGNPAEGETVYTPVYGVAGKAGAVYEVTAAEDIMTPDGTVRAEAGETVGTITTDGDGNAETKELYLGKYRVVETTAPFGCVLDSEAHEVEIAYAGQEVPVTEIGTAFYNERQKAAVDLAKTLEQDETFAIGNKGEIQNVAFGLYAAEDLTASNGDIIPADGLLETISCDMDGTASFQSDLPLGKYYVKEICTDGHYVLPDKKYPVEFSYQGQDTAFANIHANEGDAIENELLRGRISGIKVDAEDKPLGKAEIGLFPTDAEEFTGETALLVSVSGKDGAFSFEGVPFGNYIVREIESPKGYVLDGESHYVSVAAEGEMVKIKITNKPITGSVRLKKVDADYPKNKLAGAVFELYRDTDGNGKFNPEKDKLVSKIPETDKGIYQKEGLLYGGYFVKEKAAPKGFKLDKKAYFFEVKEDGKIVDVENKAGVGFINKPGTSKLELTKKDVSDGKLLPNAKFRIKDKDGNVVATGVTDGNGLAAFTLRYGKYTYQEYEAPEGYLIDEREFPFEIKEDGKVVKATMTNEKIQEEKITTPKTGDDSNAWLWTALSAQAGAGMAGFGILAARKIRKKED